MAVVNGVGYLASGEVQWERLGNGVTWTRRYFGPGGAYRLKELEAAKPGVGLVQHLKYTYDVTFLNYLVTDHLGSMAVVLDGSGGKVGEVRYEAWGETRYTWGTVPTSLGYTGQRQEAALGRAGRRVARCRVTPQHPTPPYAGKEPGSAPVCEKA